MSKRPVSVLAVIHTPALDVLMLERASHPGYWQSVTGSQEDDEPLIATAKREVAEETGIVCPADAFEDWRLSNRFEIFAEWRHRYAPGVTHNTEHVFGLKLPAPLPVTLSQHEHLNYVWLPWEEAAERCFSPSNAAAIRQLPKRL